MSLKIEFNPKRLIKWVALGLVGLFILIFFIRVATFEDAYYREKEGSERAVTETASEVVVAEEELIEEEPTEEEVYEYTVAADRPRYLSIDKLRIYNSRVLAVTVNLNGALGTPNNIFDVGWYDASGKPGQGGTMLIDGHNGGPHVYGVFKRLPDLEVGDIITIERGDGVVFRYSVVENKEIALDDADKYMATAMKTPVAGKESLTLITCSGDWSYDRDTYLSRQFVRAVLAD